MSLHELRLAHLWGLRLDMGLSLVGPRIAGQLVYKLPWQLPSVSSSSFSCPDRLVVMLWQVPNCLPLLGCYIIIVKVPDKSFLRS